MQNKSGSDTGSYVLAFLHLLSGFFFAGGIALLYLGVSPWWQISLAIGFWVPLYLTSGAAVRYVTNDRAAQRGTDR